LSASFRLAGKNPLRSATGVVEFGLGTTRTSQRMKAVLVFAWARSVANTEAAAIGPPSLTHFGRISDGFHRRMSHNLD
jgi:hypothetical protein